jgi:hypothetical protein
MKIIFKAMTILTVLSFASIAFATQNFTDTSSTVIGGGTFKVSKGVTLSATADSGAYSATSHHTNGDKEYGTNSTDPKIFAQAKPSGGWTSTSATTTDFSSWTAQ